MGDSHLMTFKQAAGRDISHIAAVFLRLLDPDGHYPLPKISITNRAGADWLGRAFTRLTGDGKVVTGVSGEIQIQRGALEDDKTLHRVLAHEVVHYVVAWEMYGGAPYGDVRGLGAKEGDHGPRFLEVAGRLNALYGSDFITITSDESYVYEHREVNLFVLAQQGASSKMMWCWSATVPQKVVDTMIEWRAQGSGMIPIILRASDPALVIPQAKAPNWKSVEFVNELEAIKKVLDKGTNLFADYASKVKKPTAPRQRTWTLVMANPYRFGTERYKDNPSHLNAWALPRALTEPEQSMLGQLASYGIVVRHRRVKGADDLFDTLKRFDIQDVANRYGAVDIETGAQWVQDRLSSLWYGAKQEVAAPQKTAAADPLLQAIRKAYKGEELWDILADYGPFDGGCLICAKAILLAAGHGELVRIVSTFDDPAQENELGGRPVGYHQTEHYGALVNGKIYDFGGVFPNAQAWIDYFSREEGLYRRCFMEKGQGEPESDIPQDEAKTEAIAKLLVRPPKIAALGHHTIYLDMDGVLADYDKGAEAAGISLDEFHATPGAFRHLDLMPGAREALKRISQVPGWTVALLSTPSKERFEEASREKREWAAENLPMILPENIHLTDDKSTVGTEQDILVDDHPEWSNADKFPGTVIHFTGPEVWDAVLEAMNGAAEKVAGLWGADADRYNAREDTYRAGEVQRGLRLYFNQLLSTLQVQAGGRTMPLRSFLLRSPVSELFRSTDRSIRLVGNQLRSELLAFLQKNYTPEQIKQFQESHGSNVTDWILKKVVAKKAELFTKR